MKSKSLPLALAAAITVVGLPLLACADDDDTPLTVAEQLARAKPEEPGTHGAHAVHYVLEGVEGVEVGLGILEATGAIAGVFEVVGPVAGAAAFWLQLGMAHQEAINSLIRDQMLSGFSQGIVLGADDRKPDYVKWNFWKWSPVPNAVYPEYSRKLQNTYNTSLAAGYAQGRKLLEHKDQRSAFFEDLYSRMSTHPAFEFGEDQDKWSERDWINYYVVCAAVFRRDHLE